MYAVHGSLVLRWVSRPGWQGAFPFDHRRLLEFWNTPLAPCTMWSWLCWYVLHLIHYYGLHLPCNAISSWMKTAIHLHDAYYALFLCRKIRNTIVTMSTTVSQGGTLFPPLTSLLFLVNPPSRFEINSQRRTEIGARTDTSRTISSNSSSSKWLATSKAKSKKQLYGIQRN